MQVHDYLCSDRSVGGVGSVGNVGGVGSVGGSGLAEGVRACGTCRTGRAGSSLRIERYQISLTCNCKHLPQCTWYCLGGFQPRHSYTPPGSRRRFHPGKMNLSTCSPPSANFEVDVSTANLVGGSPDDLGVVTRAVVKPVHVWVCRQHQAHTSDLHKRIDTGIAEARGSYFIIPHLKEINRNVEWGEIYRMRLVEKSLQGGILSELNKKGRVEEKSNTVQFVSFRNERKFEERKFPHTGERNELITEKEKEKNNISVCNEFCGTGPDW